MEKKYIYLISGILVLSLIGFYYTSNNSGPTSGKTLQNSSGPTSGNTSSKDGDLDTVKMALYANYDPVYVGQEKGFYREEGIKIDFVGALPFEQMVMAVVNGDINVASGHANRVINGITNGAKIKAIAAASKTIPGYPHMTLFVLEKSNIKSAKDLIGKKVAIWGFGGCSEFMMYEYMRQKVGVSNPKESIELVSMPDAQQEQALKSGLVDAVFIHAPYSKKLTNTGGVTKLFDDNDLEKSLGLAPYFVSDDFIEKHPDVVKRFVKATAKSLDWSNEHREEAYQITALRLDMDVKDMEGFYSPEHGLIIDSEVQNWISTLTNYGLVKDGQIKTSDIYTNEFNPYFKN